MSISAVDTHIYTNAQALPTETLIALENADGEFSISTVGNEDSQPSSAASTSDAAQSIVWVTVTSTCTAEAECPSATIAAASNSVSTPSDVAVPPSSAPTAAASSSSQPSIATITNWHTFTSTPIPSSSLTSAPPSETLNLDISSVKLTAASKAGIGVSVTSFVFLFVFLPIGICCWKRRRRSYRAQPDDRPECHGGDGRDIVDGVKAELEDKHIGLHDIPDPRILGRRRKMPAEMEGHAMSLNQATTWAGSEVAKEPKERTELGESVRACELGDPGIVYETPTRRKTRSGNENYEVARWGQTLEGIGQEHGEV